MSDKKGPGKEFPGGERSAEEILSEGRYVSYGQKLMPSMQTAVDALHAALTSTPADRYAFQVPSFEGSRDINPVSVMLIFLCIMSLNEWLKTNAIIVSFGTRGGGTLVGVAKKEDRTFWESEAGKQALRTEYVNIYTVDDYRNLLYAQFPQE